MERATGILDHETKMDLLEEKVTKLKILGKMGKMCLDCQYILGTYSLSMDVMALWLEFMIQTVQEIDDIVTA